MSGKSSQNGKDGAARGVSSQSARADEQQARAAGSAGGSARSQRAAHAAPEWAGGLRQLYDSILDEPLPDSFQSLLAKLDAESGPGEDGHGGSGAPS